MLSIRRSKHWHRLLAATLPLAVAGCAVDAPQGAATTAAAPDNDQAGLATGGGCANKAVVIQQEQTLRRIHADGTASNLFTFGAASGVAREDVNVLQWDTLDGFVAAIARLETRSGPSNYEHVLLDPDGVVVHHEVRRESHSPTIFLGQNGSLAVSSGAGSYVVFRGGTKHMNIGDFKPVAPLDLDVSLVADGIPWAPGTALGWLHLADGLFAPLTVQPAARSVRPLADGRAVYVSETGDQVVITSPLATNTVALPTGSWNLTTVTPDGRFALLTEDGAHIRVDLQALVVEEIVAQAGAGGASSPLTLIDVLALAEDGDLLRAFLVTEGLLQLRRSNDLGATWSDVGAAIAVQSGFGRGSLLPVARNGAVMVQGLSWGFGAYVEELQLVSAANVTSRVDTGGFYVNTLLQAGTGASGADLSADGACAATWIGTDGEGFSSTLQLAFVDAASGQEPVVLTDQTFGELRFIEAP